MSILKVNTITGIIDMPKNVRIKGGLLGVNFTVDSLGALPDSTSSDSFRPSAGDWFWDSPNTTLKIYLNDSHGWKNIGLTDSAGVGGSSANHFATATKMIMWGGYSGSSNTNTIDATSLETQGNATDFGDNHRGTDTRFDCSTDNSRVLKWGGNSYGAYIDYITVSTTGNSTAFGQLVATKANTTCFDDATYSCETGGSSPSYTNQIQYVTTQTTGNATDFGDTTSGHQEGMGHGDGTYGLIALGKLSSPQYVTDIDYVTVATPGNSSDFGDLTVARNAGAGMGTGAYAVFASGYSNTWNNVIDYVATATPGNCVDFGDDGLTRLAVRGGSNSTRGLIAGGAYSSTWYNQIWEIVMVTPGNATDYADLTVGRGQGGSGVGT
jgi:hypothetical protein